MDLPLNFVALKDSKWSFEEESSEQMSSVHNSKVEWEGKVNVNSKYESDNDYLSKI